MKISRGYPRVTIAVLTLAVITVSIVFVVYSQGTNTIQGCYSNGNGSLRRVNSPADCNNSETPISWNVTGPQGPPGGTIGITGKWEGTLTGTDPGRCYPDSNALRIIFIEVPSGDITGAVRIGTGTASSVFGAVVGSNLSFDTGGSGVLLSGTLQDSNNMSGTVSDCCFSGPPCGTWSVQRIPPSP